MLFQGGVYTDPCDIVDAVFEPCCFKEACTDPCDIVDAVSGPYAVSRGPGVY